MQVSAVISYLIERHGGGANAVSRDLCRSREYARNAAARPRPSLDTVADVADVAGIDVVLVDRATGERLGVVDPPRRARPD